MQAAYGRTKALTDAANTLAYAKRRITPVPIAPIYEALGGYGDEQPFLFYVLLLRASVWRFGFMRRLWRYRLLGYATVTSYRIEVCPICHGDGGWEGPRYRMDGSGDQVTCDACDGQGLVRMPVVIRTLYDMEIEDYLEHG